MGVQAAGWTPSEGMPALLAAGKAVRKRRAGVTEGKNKSPGASLAARRTPMVC